MMGSTSSSTESLNSTSSKPGFSPRTGPSTPSSTSSYSGGAGAAPDRPRRPSHDMPTYGNVSALGKELECCFVSCVTLPSPFATGHMQRFVLCVLSVCMAELKNWHLCYSPQVLVFVCFLFVWMRSFCAKC